MKAGKHIIFFVIKHLITKVKLNTMNTYCYIKECIKRKEFYFTALIINMAVDIICFYIGWNLR